MFVKSTKLKVIFLALGLLSTVSAYGFAYYHFRKSSQAVFDSPEVVIYHKGGSGGVFNLFFKPAMFVDELINGKKIVVEEDLYKIY